MSPLTPSRNLNTPGRPIHVCFLIDQLATGGTETQLLKLIDALDRTHVVPHLCLLNGAGELSRSLEPQSCQVERLGVRVLLHPSTIGKLFGFAALLRRWKIDLLQVYFPDSTYFGVPAAKLARVPCIVRTRRDLFYWRTPLQRRFGRYLDALYNQFFVDAMITNSQACRQAALDAERPAPAKVVVIENGIDLTRFDSSDFTPPLATKGAPARVGALSMLRPEKRVDVLLEAARVLTRRDPNIVYQVAGDGPMRPSLEKRIKQDRLVDRFHLLGVVRNAPAFLSDIDIAVICSDTEGASNSLIEYMLSGRAIVATAVGGNRDMIADGVDGLLVPPGDPCALAEAIGQLIDNPHRARRLGSAAQEKARQRYSLQAAVRAHQDLYVSLLND